MKTDKPRNLSKEDLLVWEQVKKTFDHSLSKAEKKRSLKTYDLEEPMQKAIRPEEVFAPKREKIIKPIRKTSEFKSTTTNYKGNKLDKKRQTLLRKGKIEPEKILDLHGLNAKKAEKLVLDFLLKNYLNGVRLALIITGKGKRSREADNSYDTEQDTGILKRSLITWVEKSNMRPTILDILPAHAKHGGGGAFYVYLRKSRENCL